MSILMGFLALMGTLGVILWRLNAAADAAKGLVETADDARGLFRRWKWRKKFADNPLDLIQDPREAAAAMMTALAQADGPLTDRERVVIVTEISRSFSVSAKQAEEFLAHARFLTRDVKDLDTCLRRLAPKIKSSCTPEEAMDLLAMLDKVANADAPAGTIETQALQRLKRELIAER
jgi:uncharacterized tellurite resistance protein B-like protein